MSGKYQPTSRENSSLKAAALVIPPLLLSLLAGAVLYYKQRMLFIDAPHVFFRIVNDGHLQIEENRIGSFITQMVPLLGSKLHVPFRLLLILYSACFYFFYLLVVLLLVFKYRNYGLALLFGLYLTLFVSDTYYWPNNEVHQGIAWLMLAFAVNFFTASKNRPLLFTAPLFAASFYLAIWTHPLVMLAAVYLWFFFRIDKKYWPYPRTVSFVYTGILLLLAFLKYYQGRHGGYDSSKIEVVTQFRLHKISTVFSSPQFHFIIKSCISDYWLFVLLFTAGVIGLVWEKKYLLLLWTVAFAAAYLLLVCITFWNFDSGRFYIESEYMPLSIICCAPFVYYVLPKFNKKIAVITVILICCIRLGYIYHAAAPFTNRVAVMDKMINKMKEKNLTKVIIPEPVPGLDSALIMNWGAPVESIFLSKLKGDVPQRTFIFLSPDMIRSTVSIGKDTLLACWERRTVKNTNTYYFQVDTASGYRVMSYESLME
jgi:hypothetical protein